MGRAGGRSGPLARVAFEGYRPSELDAISNLEGEGLHGLFEAVLSCRLRDRVQGDLSTVPVKLKPFEHFDLGFTKVQGNLLACRHKGRSRSRRARQAQAS